MSLGVCIPDLIKDGKLPKGKAAEALRRYKKMVKASEDALGRPAAEATATAEIVRQIERDIAYKKATAKLQVSAQDDWAMTVGSGDRKARAATKERMARIDKRIDAVRNAMLTQFDAFLEHHRRNLRGQLRNRNDLIDVVRARFGETVDDLNARELADAMGRSMDLARQRYNAAGGNIGKLDDYGFPQSHSSRKVGALSYEEWAATPEISRARVRDVEADAWASGARRDEILRAAYANIASDGGAAMQIGAGGRGAMASQRGDARVIHFDNADDWLGYLERFGESDNVYDVFVGHLGAMARNIALMEEMGPNPAQTLRVVQDLMEKGAKTSGDQGLAGNVNAERRRLQNLYDEITGANKIPDNRRIALVFSTVRSVQVAAKLGSAILSAVPDAMTMAWTAHFNNVPVMRTMGRYFQLWTPGSAADRRLAVRLGLVTDEYIALSSATARYTGEELTGEISRRMAEFVMRAQGLARHTRNGQWAFGMEYLGMLSHSRDRSFGQLDPAVQRQMTRYGIGEGDWDAYRATATRDERGTAWIFPTDVGDRKVGERFLEMVLSETDYAMLMPDVRTRALFGRAAPGSLGGELLKSAFLFKSFPMAILNLHGRRMLDQPGMFNKARYGLGLAGLMIAGGAVSAQLKMLANGKDPQPMNDRRFWAKAAAQSGAFGLAGDLMYNSTNSYGGGLGETLLGPVASSAITAGGATLGNAARALDGDPATETHFARDVTRWAMNEVPGQSLWYTRTAVQRTFGDMVREWADPDYAQAYARMERRAENEGSAYWYRPGGRLPERMPDFGNVMGREAAAEEPWLQ